MGERTWFRIALGYLTVITLQIGLWALVAPRSFYDGFPGLGRTWVSVDGPYNEHLVRDVGALNLALAAVMIAAAITLNRAVVMIAAIATLAWGVPHFSYHVTNTAGLSNGDLAASLSGLAVFATIPVALLATAKRLPTT